MNDSNDPTRHSFEELESLRLEQLIQHQQQRLHDENTLRIVRSIKDPEAVYRTPQDLSEQLREALLRLQAALSFKEGREEPHPEPSSPAPTITITGPKEGFQDGDYALHQWYSPLEKPEEQRYAISTNIPEAEWSIDYDAILHTPDGETPLKDAEEYGIKPVPDIPHGMIRLLFQEGKQGERSVFDALSEAYGARVTDLELRILISAEHAGTKAQKLLHCHVVRPEPSLKPRSDQVELIEVVNRHEPHRKPDGSAWDIAHYHDPLAPHTPVKYALKRLQGTSYSWYVYNVSFIVQNAQGKQYCLTPEDINGMGVDLRATKNIERGLESLQREGYRIQEFTGAGNVRGQRCGVIQNREDIRSAESEKEFEVRLGTRLRASVWDYLEERYPGAVAFQIVVTPVLVRKDKAAGERVVDAKVAGAHGRAATTILRPDGTVAAKKQPAPSGERIYTG